MWTIFILLSLLSTVSNGCLCSVDRLRTDGLGDENVLPSDLIKICDSNVNIESISIGYSIYYYSDETTTSTSATSGYVTLSTDTASTILPSTTGSNIEGVIIICVSAIIVIVLVFAIVVFIGYKYCYLKIWTEMQSYRENIVERASNRSDSIDRESVRVEDGVDSGAGGSTSGGDVTEAASGDIKASSTAGIRPPTDADVVHAPVEIRPPAGGSTSNADELTGLNYPFNSKMENIQLNDETSPHVTRVVDGTPAGGIINQAYTTPQSGMQLMRENEKVI